MKLHLAGARVADRVNYDDLVYGFGAASLCTGGDGEMRECEVLR